MHLWISLAELHRTLVSIPDLFVQVCSAWAKARLFCCLMAWKSLVPEASVWGIKSWGHSLLSQGGCCLTSGQVQVLRVPEAISYEVTAHGTLPLALISFHQWGCPVLSIYAWIHLWGWLTGSSPPFGLNEGWDWDQPAEGLVWTLGKTPPLKAGWHWGQPGGIHGHGSRWARSVILLFGHVLC